MTKIIQFKLVELSNITIITIITTMELTESLFMIFVIVTMTSHAELELFMLFGIIEKRLEFIITVIIVIVIQEKQLCELYISYTMKYNHKYFGYLHHLCFGSRYCGNSWSFSHGTHGFNPYEYIFSSHKTITEKTMYLLCF